MYKSTKFLTYLDNYSNKLDVSSSHYKNLIANINQYYLNTNNTIGLHAENIYNYTDTSDTDTVVNYIPDIIEPDNIPIKTKHINITTNVSCINDLIQIID